MFLCHRRRRRRRVHTKWNHIESNIHFVPTVRRIVCTLYVSWARELTNSSRYQSIMLFLSVCQRVCCVPLRYCIVGYGRLVELKKKNNQKICCNFHYFQHNVQQSYYYYHFNLWPTTGVYPVYCVLWIEAMFSLALRPIHFISSLNAPMLSIQSIFIIRILQTSIWHTKWKGVIVHHQ